MLVTPSSRRDSSHDSRADSRNGVLLPPVLLTVVAVNVGDDSSRAARLSLSVSACSPKSGIQSRYSCFGSMGNSRAKGEGTGLSSLECDGDGEYTCDWYTW